MGYFSTPGRSGFGGYWFLPAVLAFLLNYLTATFVRASEAAYTDPREGGAFIKNVTAAQALVVGGTNIVPGAWDVSVGLATLATGQADPAGGTDAVTLTDASAVANRYAQTQTGTNPAVATWVTWRLKKDAATTGWSTMYVYTGGAARIGVDVDQRTGEHNVSFGTPQGLTVQEIDGWLYCSAYMTGYAGVGLYARIYPSYGATQWTVAASAQASVTVYDLRVVLASEITSPTPWAYENEARIFADGAILIEGASANIHNESNIDGAGWSTSGTPVLTSGLLAPDGSLTAVLMEDDNGAGYEGRTDVVAVVTATQYTSSVFMRKDADTSRFPGMSHVDGTTRRWMLNTQTGAISDVLANYDSLRVVDEGDWWRVEATLTTNGVGLNVVTYGALGVVWGAISATATGSAVFWGLQTELGAFATSPIRAFGSPQTRAADRVPFAIDASLAAKLESPAGHTWHVWPRFSSTDVTGANRRVFGIGTSHCDLFRNGTSGATWILWSTVAVVTVVGPAWSAHDHLRFSVKIVPSGEWRLVVENLTAGGSAESTAAGPAITTNGKTLQVGAYQPTTGYELSGAHGRPVVGMAA